MKTDQRTVRGHNPHSHTKTETRSAVLAGTKTTTTTKRKIKNEKTKKTSEAVEGSSTLHPRGTVTLVSLAWQKGVHVVRAFYDEPVLNEARAVRATTPSCVTTQAQLTSLSINSHSQPQPWPGGTPQHYFDNKGIAKTRIPPGSSSLGSRCPRMSFDILGTRYIRSS